MRSTEKSFDAKRGSLCDKVATNLRLDVAEWTARLALPWQWRGEKRGKRIFAADVWGIPAAVAQSHG
jgi:hypothetical protein